MFKKPWFMLLLGFVIGALVVWWPSGLGIHTFMVVESKSPMGYEDTVESIRQATIAKGWKIPTVHRLDKSMKKFGYDILPVAVIELCHPVHAVKILQDDDARLVSSFMPCRVSVYETSNGDVTISRMNSALMSNIFPTNISKVMARATSEVEDILQVATSTNPKALPKSDPATAGEGGH